MPEASRLRELKSVLLKAAPRKLGSLFMACPTRLALAIFMVLDTVAAEIKSIHVMAALAIAVGS